ncbi:MFS transporter [Peribacillus simplex]|uniref:MFS transporter n=1 Tax=Peribacillus simplex TaxID=1478 RepID=UPI003398FF19
MGQIWRILSEQLNTSASGISYLVSAIGIGKLVSLFFAGRLSDKLGRKPFVVSASFIYLIFLIGIHWLLTTHWHLYLLCVLVLQNSFLDAGTYPALIGRLFKESGFRYCINKSIRFSRGRTSTIYHGVLYG